ncbi:MAG: hypothetical protein KJ711_05785 [Candidatus Omnitrophica bacterium]|nr:hypothetical protein [Candidatus Omnitrophota bacterium]
MRQKQLRGKQTDILSRIIHLEEFKRKIEKLTNCLSPREKEVFRLRFKEGKKLKEVALIFKVTPAAISYQAKKILKKAVKLGIVPAEIIKEQKPRLLSEKSIQMAKLYFLRGWSIKQISFIGRITDCVTRPNVQRVLRRLKEIFPLSIGEFTVAAHRITCGKLHSCINEIKQSELSTDLEEALEEYTSRGVKKEGQPSKNYFTESQLKESEELIDNLFH